MPTNRETTPMLTVELLERLRSGWDRHGAPLVGYLRPGLERNQIDALTKPLGLRLPDEAAVWWNWHDGVDVGHGAEVELGPSLPFVPLETAVELCGEHREQAALAWEDRAQEWWRSSWFPITERLGAIRCDCSVKHDAPTPIFYADSHDYDREGLTQPRVGSFGEMVIWWIEALENGAWRYEAQAGRWERDDRLLPPERLRSGLV